MPEVTCVLVERVELVLVDTPVETLTVMAVPVRADVLADDTDVVLDGPDVVE